MRSSFTLLLVFFYLSSFQSFGQTSIVCPPNIGLEMGNFTNWRLYTGVCCPINANTLQGGPVNNRHVITTGNGVDPYGGFPIVAPGGGVYSMRLGNDNDGSQAERARYYVQVPSGVNNYSIIFRYAVVFEDPGHDTSEQPRFEVKAYDSATNDIVPCSHFTFVAGSSLPGFQLAGSTSTSDIWYKSWTTASIDLSNYGGKTVAIDFASGDCDLGAHFGYGYVDLNCGLLPTNTVVCSTSPTFSITAPPGFQDYEWRDSTLTTLLDTGQVGVFNTPATSTKYAVILNPYTGFGCPDTIFTQVTISSTTVDITTPDTIVCNGTTLQLNTSTVATTGPITYSWTPTTGLSCSNCANPVVTLPANTKYVVTATNGNGCPRKDSITIKSSNISIATTKLRTSCFGSSDGTMTAIPSGGKTPYTYAWNTTPVQTTATATGLAAGLHTVTVTDSFGCTKSKTDTVKQPTLLTAATTHTNVSCLGGNSGTAAVLPSGGTAPYTYSWNTTPVKTASIATGLTAGTYTVTVTDSSGCTTTAQAIITQPAALTATTTKTDATCFGGTNGTATAIPSGGTGPYTYSWNTTPVKTTATATGLAAGTYTVTVTDVNGCATTATATVGQPAAVSATTTKTDASCNGGANGTATALPSGGTGPYTYSWNTTPVQTTVTATGLSAGTYTVTVRDVNNCIGTATATVGQPTAVTATTSKTDASCNGGSNGTATAIPGGGTAPYTYSWNTIPVQTTVTATGLSAGTYTVTVTDNNGCIKTATATIGQPAVLAATTNKSDASCNGGNNGIAAVNVTGGTAPYTYSWNTTPVKTTSIATGLSAGTYTVTVTDNKGCLTTASATIGQPNALLATATTTDASCYGGSNGTATVSPAGGTAPYTYSWNTTPVKTTATATGLVAGTYTVTVTDANNCTTTAIATVGQPTAVAATTTKTDVSCNGGTNGTATGAGSGGTPPYTYSWNTSPAQTIATATGLAAGTYTVTVKDANNCTTTATATIGQPTVVTATTTKTNVSCNGGSNGTATATAAGGTAPYTYSWNTTPVQTTSTATNLSAGTYTVTVTDNNGCVKTATATIGQPTLLTATTTKTDALCNGSNNGTATAIPSGGTGPYTYSWNTTPVQTTITATGLANSTYIVTVTDANGCVTTATATVGQPNQLNASAVKTDVSCFNGSNGTATVTATGGITPYTYSWNTIPIKTTAAVTGLSAGTYTVTVADAQNCVVNINVTINQPTALTSTTSKTDVSCNGGANGTAMVTAAGGTGAYTYSWNTTPVKTTATITGLIAGTYTVTVKDSNNCITTSTITVGQPTVLNATAAKTDVSCNGGSNGTATVTPQGGTAPYAYSWNTVPVQAAATATGLPAGTYIATVTDANGCVTTASVTITQPALLTATTTKVDATCFSGSNGTATALPTGGTGPYTYSWNTTPAQTTATATALANGSYTVTITDANGCVVAANATIGQPNQLNATAVKTDVSCFNGTNGTATVAATGGITPYTYSWNTNPVQTTATATNLAAGTYTVTVTDSQNCTVNVAITVGQPTLLTATTSQTDVSCNGGADGTAMVVGAGGTPPYTYSWTTTPVLTTAAVAGLTAGSYTATITDGKGCVATAVAVVGQPPVLNITLSRANVSCYAGSNGAATVLAQGGTTPYVYSWNTTPVKTTSTAAGLAAGTYSVTVTDAKGCKKTDSITVGQPVLLTVTTTKTNVSCYGGANGTAAATPAGGIAPYTYSWNTTPTQATATATGLSNGSYTVIVTDANGCTASIITTITQPTLLNASATRTNATCNAKPDGTATVVATGGTIPYTYSWNTTPAQTNATATSLVAGTYIVTTTDSNGCTTKDTVIVNHPAALLQTLTKVDAKCYGDSNGTATVVTTGGTSPYAYTWLTTPVVTTATIAGLPVGVYKVAVKDSNNCLDTGTIVIGQPALLTASTTKVDVRCFGESSGSANVTAAGGTVPYSFLWNSSPAQTTSNASSLPVGKYTVVVTDAHGCKVAAITDSLMQPDSLSVTAIGTATCFGQTTGTATATATGGTAPYTHTWHTQPPQSGNNAANLSAGRHSVFTSDANGCIDTASAAVAELPLPVVIGKDNATICEGGKIPLVASGAKNYVWSPAGSLSCSTCNITIAAPHNTTTYVVIGTDTNNCSDTDHVVINVIPDIASSVGPDLDICIGDAIQLTANGGGLYTWSPSTALSDSTIATPVSRTDTTITYKVIIIENECFTDTLYQTVRVHQRPTVNLGPDKRGMPGAIIQLHADTTKATTITWEPKRHLSCDDCTDPLATLYKTVTYIATVSNGVCVDTDDIRIVVGCDDQLFFVPNTFTPNGDGANDRFYPMAEGVSKIDRFRVYDRWGEPVHIVTNFAPNDPAFGWDGRHKGAELSPDVYVWYLESTCGNGEKLLLKGDISLIR